MGSSLHRFLAFLRVGEFTAPSSQAFDPGVHHCLADLAVDSHQCPFSFSPAHQAEQNGSIQARRRYIFLGATKS